MYEDINFKRAFRTLFLAARTEIQLPFIT